MVPVSDAIERRTPILAAGDRLPIDNAGLRAQLGHCLDDERKAIGQVIARPTVQLHPLAVLAGNDPKTCRADGCLKLARGPHWIISDFPSGPRQTEHIRRSFASRVGIILGVYGVESTTARRCLRTQREA